MTKSSFFSIYSAIYCERKYYSPESNKSHSYHNLEDKVLSMPALNGGVLLKIWEAIFIVCTHEKWERIVYNGGMPQQHDNEESCHQLLYERRLRISCKIGVKAWFALKGLAVMNGIMNVVLPFNIVYLFISNVHDLWLRLLLHYLGDVLVFSRSRSRELIVVISILEIVIAVSIAVLIFAVASIPSLIACIESLHITLFVLTWKI